jgi:hypothetical protein
MLIFFDFFHLAILKQAAKKWRKIAVESGRKTTDTMADGQKISL